MIQVVVIEGKRRMVPQADMLQAASSARSTGHRLVVSFCPETGVWVTEWRPDPMVKAGLSNRELDEALASWEIGR